MHARRLVWSSLVSDVSCALAMRRIQYLRIDWQGLYMVRLFDSFILDDVVYINLLDNSPILLAIVTIRQPSLVHESTCLDGIYEQTPTNAISPLA